MGESTTATVTRGPDRDAQRQPDQKDPFDAEIVGAVGPTRTERGVNRNVQQRSWASHHNDADEPKAKPPLDYAAERYRDYPDAAPPLEPFYVSIPETSRLTGLSTVTIYRLIANERLVCVKAGAKSLGRDGQHQELSRLAPSVRR